MTKKYIFISFLILIIILIACDHKTDNPITKDGQMDLKTTSTLNWEKIANKNIYFGHQSVGYNIVDGIQELLNTNPHINLKIIEGVEGIEFSEHCLIHATNGHNKNPKSKIDAFYKTFEDSLAEQVDIAGFKFCYIDFINETNIDEIFEHYKSTMHELIKKYPDVQIVHFTVPLRTIQKGPKAFIKKIIGKKIGLLDNYKRMQFNKLLLEEFKGQPIFDIAKFESTYQDGNREFVIMDEDKVYALVPDYTYDGGHLNDAGKKYIAKQFLFFLAELPNE